MNIGIDLGTANILVYAREKIVLREPSVVAINKNNNKIMAVGEKAREMQGRTPANIIAVRPLKDGVIADYEITEIMLKYLIKRVARSFLFLKPQVIISIPAKVTGVERRAVQEAALVAGARRVQLIEEPIAAAIGAGLHIEEPTGRMVVDIGGGTTDMAVISLGDMVVSESLRVAGDKMDEAIVKYIRREFNLVIGERTAEEIKMQIGSAYPLAEELVNFVKGRDLVDGSPKTVEIRSEDIRKALDEPVRTIISSIKSVIEKTPPELVADIIEQGIWLTGGCALLKGMNTLISEEIEVPVYVPDNPLDCVVIGAGKSGMIRNE